MPKLKTDGRTDPNFRKASLLKRHFSWNTCSISEGELESAIERRGANKRQRERESVFVWERENERERMREREREREKEWYIEKRDNRKSRDFRLHIFLSYV